MNALEIEIADRIEHGAELVTVAEMERRFRAIGYRLDRPMDCRSMARIMTGPRAGQSYPCCTTSAVELSTGAGFANTRADRKNLPALQKLRHEIFAISRGAILEV